MGFAVRDVPSKPTKVVKQGRSNGQDLIFIQCDHETIDLTLEQVSGLKQTAMGIGPTALMEKPWLDDHGTQCGVEFRQKARRLFAAPFINLAVLFPEPEETLTLPVKPGENEHIRQREHATGNRGE
jgi:hypothetical protein